MTWGDGLVGLRRSEIPVHFQFAISVEGKERKFCIKRAWSNSQPKFNLDA